jgi:hypothetical protein
MNADEALHRLTEAIRRKQLAPSTERRYCAWLRRYCDYLKELQFHLPNEQKPDRLLTALAGKHVPQELKIKPLTRSFFEA